MSDFATFEIGDLVRVVTGPVIFFRGIVKDVNEARFCLKVAVSIFGRVATVDLKFSDVEIV